MTLWHEKEIPVCIQIMKSGVTIFGDIECTALVDYDVINGELEYEITGFRFIEKDLRVVIDKSDIFQFNQLKGGVQIRQIEQALNDSLTYSYDIDSGLSSGCEVVA